MARIVGIIWMVITFVGIACIVEEDYLVGGILCGISVISLGWAIWMLVQKMN